MLTTPVQVSDVSRWTLYSTMQPQDMSNTCDGIQTKKWIQTSIQQWSFTDWLKHRTHTIHTWCHNNITTYYKYYY